MKSSRSKLFSPVLYPATYAVAILIWLAASCTLPVVAYAQDSQDTYTVVPGDTLAEIADRLNVSLDSLVRANQIIDPAYIQVGQVLVVPNPDGSLPLSTIRTSVESARPGDTIDSIAARYSLEPDLLAELNETGQSGRLFPGQPIELPSEVVAERDIRYGSVIDMEIPEAIAQGRTGRIEIGTTRPLDLAVSWNDLPIPMTPVDGDPLRYFGFTPVPALIQPGIYSLTVAYTTLAGDRVSRSWPIVVAPGIYASESIILSDEVNQLLAPSIVAAELALVSDTWSVVSPDLLLQDRFLRPIAEEYETSSPFGTRRAYGGGEVNGYHSGQDYSAPAGAPVVAPAPARVAMAAPLDVRGNIVLLDHGRGIYTGYWHLSELTVNEGQEVEAGDTIGLVGTTGLSTGNHLHWELRVYGVAVDPLQFLQEEMVP